MSNLTEIGKVNSVSYQDLVGILTGLTRTLGERSSDFKNRLEVNAVSQKSHTYEGTLENIANKLGLELFEAIALEVDDSVIDITYSFGQIVFTTLSTTIVVPTITISPDGFWVWKMFSEVVSDINALNGTLSFTAALQVDDGPSLQLVNQSNTGWILEESLISQVQRLEKYDIYVPGSAQLSDSSVTFTITNGIITLDTIPSASLTVSYRYFIPDYSLIASQAPVISMTDPALKGHVISNNDLVYQVKEVIQTLMNVDDSYWAS